MEHTNNNDEENQKKLQSRLFPGVKKRIFRKFNEP